MNYKEPDISRIIEMAWEDRTPYEAIDNLYGLSVPQLTQFMQNHLSRRSFVTWRKRHRGRKNKHFHLRLTTVTRSHCKTQYKLK
ncbi:TIGR03643 family protein [Pseudoalteromonas sp. MMG013]|uniref:TIGR03643 family protein n=1 Tax=Pseudoalteromonas sp. MMG013 TaxID=2822687 RepID=UPI001B37B783|nr:TIGR03643 family protein [Pseudoalteromonas sp. MMG013]MBQ4864293.1 TIGR03643 family protein [Pseudoalteromonas sp. MMG013]